MHDHQITAFIFPGQGSQRIGMGRDLAQKYAVADLIFKEADEILGRKLSSLMFDGVEDELKQTINTQPAIAACTYAYCKVIEDIAGPSLFSMCAGHSVGQISALICTGALTFADGLKLIQERASLMQKESSLCPGAMIALLGGSQDVAVEVARESNVDLANYNTSAQHVLSGAKDAIASASDIAKSRGFKVIPLSVGGAFHSRLMKNASLAFDVVVGGVAFAESSVPIVDNISALPRSAEQIKQTLGAQISSSVKWRESIEYMVKSGIRRFVEVGFGKAYTNMTAHISPDSEAVHCIDFYSLGL